LRCGDLVLDPAKRIVTRGEHIVDLTRTEFEIPHTLMVNAEIVLSRSQLYETIWGYDFETNSKSLDVHVGYLRRKLEQHDSARVVHTVRGIGYVVRTAKTG
jgi:two-component system response regulator MprA